VRDKAQIAGSVCTEGKTKGREQKTEKVAKKWKKSGVEKE
jgi:hypothetical protein